MVMWTIERSPNVWVYHEHAWSPAFRNYRLRPTETIDRLIGRSPAPVVAFKPLCDSHLTDRYLARHSRSKAIWIYRSFKDVANSAVRNLGEHQKNVLRWIVQGDTDRLGWRGERLPRDYVDLVHEVFREDMSSHEACALFWYVRNRLYFDLGLEVDERVLLVRYEDLVGGSDKPFARLFDFIGAEFERGFLENIFSSSVGRSPFPAIHPRVEAVCEHLAARLDEAYNGQLQRDGSEAGDSPTPLDPKT
jgi:hypothetical protein